MAKFIKWIHRSVNNLIDPEQADRVRELEPLLWAGLVKHYKDGRFNLDTLVPDGQYSTKDIQIAAENTYVRALQNAWKDGVLTDKEQQLLRWTANVLKLDEKKAKSLNREPALQVFERALDEAILRGQITEEDSQRLLQISHTISEDVAGLVRTQFYDRVVSYLRSTFLRISKSGQLIRSEWKNLLASAQNLGLTPNHVHHALGRQSQELVEHVLADARSDGKLSKGEEEELTWLLTHLGLSDEFRQYVVSQVSELKLITNISNGILPSVRPPSYLQLKGGEILHLLVPTVWIRTRHLKQGPTQDRYHGMLAITDDRFIFLSDSHSTNTNFRSIVSCYPVQQSAVYVATGSKPLGTFVFQEQQQLAISIFMTALGKANQTIVQTSSGLPNRHIPRDVRQRVYQKYSGRCAECNASDYLEFDHIIPVAKGGSNTENNIQLLCRRCNLKKSDHI